MKKYLLNDWKLYNDKYSVNASVPGDISDALLKAGIIEDPYFGDNANDCMWVAKESWTYENRFVYDETEEFEDVLLCFDGVDTYSEIYLNGVKVGETANMHRIYEFDVKKAIKRGENLLQVKMRSVFDEFGKNDDKKYGAIFNDDRVYIRKAQCHFGWDWAPKLPGYGIYREVYVKTRKRGELNQINISTDNGGAVTFKLDFVEKFEGEVEIEISLNGERKAFVRKGISCKRKLLNAFVDNPSLWMPNGYGEQPLYEYRISQVKDGEIFSERIGKFAFRKVELCEKRETEERNSFALKVNGVKIFAKGSNWVPADCMTGRISEEKYKSLLLAAKDANFNMLRVWGGGIYEKDCFYDYCDRFGIMIWQDFMFACSEIPDDDAEFIAELAKEAECQTKRLSLHPCVALFCGENEIAGSFSPDAEAKYSQFALRYLLRGICGDAAPDIPYIRSSPFAFADTENDASEGDSHNNLSEICLFATSFSGFDSVEYGERDDEETLKYKIKNYELFVEETKNNFSSECAVIGAANYSSLVKFTPKKELSMDSDFLRKRFLGNPYTYVMPHFFDRQKAIAEAAFGRVSDVCDFAKKTNLTQADIMKTEILYARCNGESSGFLNWMYNDIWPTGTWSVVDYYLSKKPAYYRMKSCFVPRGAALVRVGVDYFVAAMNDKSDKALLNLEVTYCDFYGNELRKSAVNRLIGEYSSELIKIEPPFQGSEYVRIEGYIGDEEVSDTYDFDRYSEKRRDAKFSYKTEKCTGGVRVRLEAETFVPRLAIFCGDDAIVEDNYFDMAAGERKSVTILTDCPNKLSIKTFSDVWDE